MSALAPPLAVFSSASPYALAAASRSPMRPRYSALACVASRTSVSPRFSSASFTLASSWGAGVGVGGCYVCGMVWCGVGGGGVPSMRTACPADSAATAAARPAMQPPPCPCFQPHPVRLCLCALPSPPGHDALRLPLPPCLVPLPLHPFPSALRVRHSASAPLYPRRPAQRPRCRGPARPAPLPAWPR
jgi:hypothetical protein